MKNDNSQLMEALGAVTNIGLTLVATIAIGLFGGRYLDGWLNTSPWFTLSGALLGVMSGFWSVYKRLAGGKEGGRADGSD